MQDQVTYSHAEACQETVTVLLLLKGFLLQFKQEKPKLVEGKVWASNPADSECLLFALYEMPANWHIIKSIQSAAEPGASVVIHIKVS